MDFSKICKFFIVAAIGLLFAVFPAFSQSLSSLLEEEDEFYKNYGMNEYSKQDIKQDVVSYYDLFGDHIADGFFVYQLASERASKGRSIDENFDSLTKARSSEFQSQMVYENFNNLMMTRDAIGGTKTTFLIGDQINTSFTPFTLNKANYKGIRWDLWTSGIKFSALVSRTRPGVTSMQGNVNAAEVTYPFDDSSFISRNENPQDFEWKTMSTDPMAGGAYYGDDYSNKSIYHDYDFFWGVHAQNMLANKIKYGVTYMNHHRSDIKKGESLRGDVPEGLIPNEIHFEFYDMTYGREDDAGCYVYDVVMEVVSDRATYSNVAPSGVYNVNASDSTLDLSSMPKIVNGWRPLIVAFEPQNALEDKDNEKILHVRFTYKVAGNYLAFVATDRSVPLSLQVTKLDNSSPATFGEPGTRTIDEIYNNNKGSTISKSMGPGNDYSATYFGDYIAKSPKPIFMESDIFFEQTQEYELGTAGAPANFRTYQYEYTINVNSITYGANVSGKLFGVSFSGEVATNVQESKFPGNHNSLDDFEDNKVRRNVFQLRADRDFLKKMNVSGEFYRIDAGYETNLSIPQPSLAFSKTTHANKTGVYDYLTYPKPLSNDWHAIDDNEDDDVYVESDRRRYPSNLPANSTDNFLNDGSILLLKGAETKAETLSLPNGMNMVYDDYDGVISDRYDKNKNAIVDYREDFLLYYSDPPVFDLQNDQNFNGVYDNEDDDVIPDYRRPDNSIYFVPYTLTSNGIVMHGLQGIRGVFSYKPVPNLELKTGFSMEKALNMNFTDQTEESDKVSDSEGKSNVGFVNGLLKVVRRAQGLDFFVGDEIMIVKDEIRNDVIKTRANAYTAEEIQVDYKYITDELRYRNAIINNLVGGVTYMNIPNFEFISRLMLGYEMHGAMSDSLYITKTRYDYTYESFWQDYKARNIAKSYFIAKCAYTQKFKIEYSDWRSVFSFLDRLEIIPQYKFAYELRKNLKEGGNIDPRENESAYSLSGDAGITKYRNDFQEYDANTEDYILSVPILRLNYKIAERTQLQTGVQWMRAFDRITETNNFLKTKYIAQIMSRDNYAGYQVSIVFGMSRERLLFDVNAYDPILWTGSSHNIHDSKIFAKVYAGI